MKDFSHDALKKGVPPGQVPLGHRGVSPYSFWQQESLPLTSDKLLSLDAIGLSHPGYVRQKNEDCFYLKTRPFKSPLDHEPSVQGIFVLCDGLGGYTQGDVASSMVTFKVVQDFLAQDLSQFISPDHLISSLQTVNHEIYQENQRLDQLGLGRMGTTAVVVTLHNQLLNLIHVGDSRCYRVTRSCGLEQLTTDHQRGQQQIARGLSYQEAYANPDAYRLTQAVGLLPNHLLSPDVKQLNIRENSLFLMCSDGLSDNHLLENYWQTHLKPYLSRDRPLNDGIQGLLDLGLRKNGHDNITILLFRVCLHSAPHSS